MMNNYTRFLIALGSVCLLPLPVQSLSSISIPANQRQQYPVRTPSPARTTLGGADLNAWKRGHVAKTRDMDSTILDMDLPSDFPVGSYFKNGPGGFKSDDGVQYLHPFDCDGKILGLTFDPSNRRVMYRYKHVETPKFKKDRQTGTVSERGFFGSPRSGGWLANIGRVMPANVANTNVILNEGGDKLFALWEAGRPFVLDPHTLETVGETDYGFLKEDMCFSAHPKYDSSRKSYTNFCLGKPDSNGHTKMKFVELDSTDFKLKSPGVTLDMPGVMLTHDSCLTDNYIIFNWVEARVNYFNALKATLGLQAGVKLIEFLPEQDRSKFVIVPRSLLESGEENIDVLNDPRIKIVKVPFCSGHHFGNAFEKEDGKVVFDFVVSDSKQIACGVDASQKEGKPIWSALDYDEFCCPKLMQFEVDVEESKFIKMSTVGDECLEFPVLPKDMATKEHKFLYMVGAHKDSNVGCSPFGALRKINTNTLEQDVYSFQPHEFVQEPGIAKKVGSSKEDGVYLIAVVTDGLKLTSDLVILDGENLSKGPIARLRLPEVVPNGGLHGNFFQGATYPFPVDNDTSAKATLPENRATVRPTTFARSPIKDQRTVVRKRVSSNPISSFVEDVSSAIWSHAESVDRFVKDQMDAWMCKPTAFKSLKKNRARKGLGPANRDILIKFDIKKKHN